MFLGVGVYSSNGSSLPSVVSPFEDLKSISSILDSNASTPFIPDYCDGFRCTLGQCINLDRVCDRYKSCKYYTRCRLNSDVADTGTVRRARTSSTVRSSPPPVCPRVSDTLMTRDCARVQWAPGTVTTTCVWVTTSGATESPSAETRRMNPPRAPRVLEDCPSRIQESCVMESRTVQIWRMKLQQLVSVRRRVGDVIC